MYPSYGLLSQLPTQSLFHTKIGMMQTFSTFSEDGYGPGPCHAFQVNRICLKSFKIIFPGHKLLYAHIILKKYTNLFFAYLL